MGGSLDGSLSVALHESTRKTREKVPWVLCVMSTGWWPPSSAGCLRPLEWTRVEDVGSAIFVIRLHNLILQLLL